MRQGHDGGPRTTPCPRYPRADLRFAAPRRPHTGPARPLRRRGGDRNPTPGASTRPQHPGVGAEHQRLTAQITLITPGGRRHRGDGGAGTGPV